MDKLFSQLIDHPDHDVEVAGLTILVQDGVFSPNPEMTHSSSMIMQGTGDLSGKRVLDMGTGTGVLAIHAAKQGAKEVLAVDPNPRAIANTETNVERHGVGGVVEVRSSDLFSDVPGKFDLVFANLPIDDEMWGIETKTVNVIETFLKQLPEHLSSDGKALLAWASFSPVEPVKHLLEKLGWSYELTVDHKFGYEWYLFAITNN